VIRTLIAVEEKINMNMNMYVPHKGNCYELFGFDVMLDKTLHPWIIEVMALNPRPLDPCAIELIVLNPRPQTLHPCAIELIVLNPRPQTLHPGPLCHRGDRPKPYPHNLVTSKPIMAILWISGCLAARERLNKYRCTKRS
jgi:hypothetical protein